VRRCKQLHLQPVGAYFLGQPSHIAGQRK
jgi:hypothetical protein